MNNKAINRRSFVGALASLATASGAGYSFNWVGYLGTGDRYAQEKT